MSGAFRTPKEYSGWELKMMGESIVNERANIGDHYVKQGIFIRTGFFQIFGITSLSPTFCLLLCESVWQYSLYFPSLWNNKFHSCFFYVIHTCWYRHYRKWSSDCACEWSCFTMSIQLVFSLQYISHDDITEHD